MNFYSRVSAIRIIGTVLVNHNMVYPGFGSQALRAREQAVDLLDEQALNAGKDVRKEVPTELLDVILSRLAAEVENKTGKRLSLAQILPTGVLKC